MNGLEKRERNRQRRYSGLFTGHYGAGVEMKS
jgi:hypothetical protein